MHCTLSTLVSFLLSMGILSGQSWSPSTFPVKEAGTNLNFPFAGGLNNPQFSETDLNRDGELDLFVYDRQGGRVLCFTHTGSGGELGYRYDASLKNLFPKMIHWALMRDYDCDGHEDLLTAYSASGGYQGIQYFRQNSSSLGFTLADTFLKYDNGGTPTFVFVNVQDVPAIMDMNGDGDLDIVSFKTGGGFIRYYENLGIENGGSCSDDEFFLLDKCWGDVYESGLGKSVDLDTCTSTFAPDVPRRHAGSTILALDLNNDGKQELILGDLQFNNLNQLNNTGTLSNAHTTLQDTAFPSYDVPVDLFLFPASFSIDVDRDGKKDLLVAPNDDNLYENFKGNLFYKDVGSSTPDFEFQHNRFLLDQMIDVGSNARACPFDYNADGLTDILIGNLGYFNPAGAKFEASLTLYKNVGTTAAPSFELVSRDYAGLKSFSALYNSYAPCAGDVDGDGDVDLVVGTHTGELIFLENTAGSGSTASFAFPITSYEGIDVGQFASPQLIDLNRDSKLDLVIGEKGGNINYFQNSGTSAAPDFSSITTDSLGKILVHVFEGYSAPWIFEKNGSYHLMTGSVLGDVQEYKNIEGNILGIYDPVMGEFSSIFEGTYTTPTMFQFGTDSTKTLLLGNANGGLNLWTENRVSGTPPSTPSDELILAPNPVMAGERLKIQGHGQAKNVQIHDLGGRLLFHLAESSEMEFQVPQLAKGLYLLRVESGNTFTHTKLLIQ